MEWWCIVDRVIINYPSSSYVGYVHDSKNDIELNAEYKLLIIHEADGTCIFCNFDAINNFIVQHVEDEGD